MTVTTENKDGIFVITIDNPPVNALGADVRSGVFNALDQIAEDKTIKAAVVIGAGRFFSGGADIKEFGKGMAEPFLPDVLSKLEAARVPVVAAIGGAALGGGLETALSCRYRIASTAASMGLPEVKLGIIPGAGGTQRLPRLVGVKAAAEMITSGKPVNAIKALAIGLIDAVADGDLLEAAITIARDMADDNSRPPLSAIEKPADWDEDWVTSFGKKIKARARGQLSPVKAFEAVANSGRLAFAEGIKREREIFLECMASDQRLGLIHSFFAERAAKKVPALEGASPREVKVIGVLGAGTMGSGIAIACAASGYSVKLFDVNEEALAAGGARIKKSFARDAEKGRLSDEAAAAATARVALIDSLEKLDDADLVIEAVIERMDVKKSVFADLDRITRPGAVLASNTSYLDINEIASATARPEDVIGMHFFSPANLMRLLEIIKTDKASADALATASAVGAKIGKVGVLAGVCPGFIGNRILKKYRQQADYLVEDGAMPSDVDRVMREFGFAMGPFQISDLAGIDIAWHNRRREDDSRDPAERYPAIADHLYEMGRLGQKSGAGWYLYKEGDRSAYPDPVVEKLILAESEKLGITRRAISDEEIRDRILFAMINEGAKVLEEGIAGRALDIDLVYLHGYGFPAFRGGPMFYADAIGLDKVLDGVREFAKEDSFAWRPSALLEKLAAEGGKFAEHQ